MGRCSARNKTEGSMDLNKVLDIIWLVVAGINLAMAIDWMRGKDYNISFWWNVIAFVFCLIMGIV